METTAQTTTRQTNANPASGVERRESSYERWIESMRFSYFGIISMFILIGSIVGAISAMYILKQDAPVWQLGLCMSAAMANLVASIGQAPLKWVVNLFMANILINTFLIVLNAI